MEGDFDTGNVRFKAEKDTLLDSLIQDVLVTETYLHNSLNTYSIS